MTDEARAFRQLSVTEALRALYIDFEGEKDKPPVLLGVLRHGGKGDRPFVHVDVVDESFAPLAESVMTLRAAVEKVVRRAEHGDRRIVSWSEHDLRVVRTLRGDDPALVTRFEGRYANARRVAERWRNKVHGGLKPTDGRLADYLTLIDYPLPDEAAPGQVGETIRVIRDRLDRGLPPIPSQLARWNRLVEHNRYDCAGMRQVTLLATRELDATGG